MGSLHDGHLSLMRAAAEQCGFVVMSLFVNPAQFGPGEDFERYPRDERRDAELAAAAGADLLFAPPLEEVYPDGFSTTVEVAGLTDVLCGPRRAAAASHFNGVATVVTKLLNMCGPDVAFFGQKDYQQSLVIRPPRARPRTSRCASRSAPRSVSRTAWRSAPATPTSTPSSASAPRASTAPCARRRRRRRTAPLARRSATRRSRCWTPPEWTPSTWRSCAPTTSVRPGGSPASGWCVAIAAQVGPARLIDNTLIELPIPSERPADEVALVGD